MSFTHKIHFTYCTMQNNMKEIQEAGIFRNKN